MFSKDLGVETLGDIEHLRGDGRSGGNNHVDCFLGHGFGETHSIAGSFVGEVGDDSILVQLGSVRIRSGRRSEGALAGISRNGALGFGHFGGFVATIKVDPCGDGCGEGEESGSGCRFGSGSEGWIKKGNCRMSGFEFDKWFRFYPEKKKRDWIEKDRISVVEEK